MRNWTEPTITISLPFFLSSSSKTFLPVFQTAVVNIRRRNYIFLILAHPVYKILIIQEQNMLELWNKLHFEEKETESIYRV